MSPSPCARCAATGAPSCLVTFGTSRRTFSVDIGLTNGSPCKTSVSAGGGYLDQFARFRVGKVRRGAVGASPHTSSFHAHAAFDPARQVMATDGNRLVCGIQRTRCAAPHTRCTLAGAGARDLAHPLLMSRKAIADDRQETRDRPNPRSARPRRWTSWRLAVETHCFCRCAAGAWRFGRSNRPREGRRPGRRSSL